MRKLRQGYILAVSKVDAEAFWKAWPAFKAAIDALPGLDLWRGLPDEFRWTLVPQMMACGITLPVNFLRSNQWLLDPNIYWKKNPKADVGWQFNYGFEIERRIKPR